MFDKDLTKFFHFLVVDDDADSRASVVEYLRVLGFQRITLAHNGTDALRLLEHDLTINFVISDWDMPLMNGLALLRRVKRNPTRSHIPFLVITSPNSAETEKISLAGENMVDGYIIKPFRCHVLKEKIQSILSSSALGIHKHVVVVDDDEDSREGIIEYVKQIGFNNVVSFVDGSKALEHLKKNAGQVGLIISDWDMPKVTGLELLRTCKNQPALVDVPFLMVTSQSSIEKMKIMQAARANVDEYMLKPFNLENFRTRIGEILEKSKTAAEVRKLSTEGTESLEKGQYHSAVLKFEEALKLNSQHEISLRGMGDAINELQGPQSALVFYKRAIEANPHFPGSYIKLAQIHDKLYNLDQAIVVLESALLQIDLNSELHFMLGKLYLKGHKFISARTEMEKTLELQPDHTEAKVLLKQLEGHLMVKK